MCFPRGNPRHSAGLKDRLAAAQWIAGVTVLVFLAVYFRTMAPTITWQNDGADSGDLVTAAINLGVPHPSGYPLFCLIAHLFATVPGAEPARSVNFMSALAAALAAGAVFWTALHMLADSQCDAAPTWAGAAPAIQTGGLFAPVAIAWAAAGTFGFGQLLWSQATIAEVHSLHALIVALLLAAASSVSGEARPYVLALLFGFGLANHLTILLLLPALWPYARVIAKWGSGRRIAAIGLCLAPGLLTYLYVPLRAAVHPVPNWGQGSTWQGFAWLVSGAAYRAYLGGLPQLHFLPRVVASAGIWVRDLGVPGLALALLGLWDGLERRTRFAWFGLSYAVLVTLYSILYSTSDSYLYLLPVGAVAAIWVARGAALLVSGLCAWTGDGPRRRAATALVMIVLVSMPLISAAARFQAMDVSADREAYAFADKVLDAAAQGAIVVSSGDLQTFPLWYLRHGLEKRNDVTVVDRNLLAFEWYRSELAVQHPALSILASTRNGQEAADALLRVAEKHPVHLTYRDDWLLGARRWSYDGFLYSLQRPATD